MDAASKRLRLRKLLNEPGLIVAPGSYDALMARLIESHGFPATHITGGGVSRSLGYPDVGLLTMTEVVARCGMIARNVNIPVIADADAGYGNCVNVKRAVEEFERAGVAAIHIEDVEEPKKCNLLVNAGHTINLISCEEMTGKIQAAIAARSDPNFMIVARICAKGRDGMDEVLKRAHAYARAGADILFLIHLSPTQLEEACKEIDVPVLYNATYHTDWASSFPGMDPTFDSLERMGLKIATLSSSVALGGLLGMDRVLTAIRRDRSAFPYLASQERFKEVEQLYSLGGTAEIHEWEERFLPPRKDHG